SEGFLPGYNFPRLPIRAYVATGSRDGEFIARPRFLAVTEFGPRNLLYHEGRKYRVVRTQIPGGNISQRFVRAKLCNVCGYFHEGEAAERDLCERCGTVLDAGTSDYSKHFFEMTDVVTQPVERITCDEEERVREGYHVTSHFRFAPAPEGVRRYEAEAQDAEGIPLLRLTFGPAATLWRLNHGWRRSRELGFHLDTRKGYWARRPDAPEDRDPFSTPGEILSGVRLLVRDTRNILLIHPLPLRGGEPGRGSEVDKALLASLQAALQRGIEAVFQIAEEELAAERIGQGEHRAILLWEAAEGGLGVLARLVEDPDALAEVAQAALEICHFTPDGRDLRPPQDPEGCARACYDCLLSYRNQWDHGLLNRHLVRDWLLRLAAGRVQLRHDLRDREAHYQWLLERTDPASELERRFLQHLY
ncbi:MAG: DUF1998 domain-containing protein, partial [Chloroflexi bacterium]